MNSFTNDDLYQIVLDRAAKDRKGSISPEEFESYLRIRNIDYFNQQMSLDGATKLSIDSLRPFVVYRDILSIKQYGTTGQYYVDLSYDSDTTTTTTLEAYSKVSNVYAHWISAFYLSSLDTPNVINEIDIISGAEIHDRINNAITEPSALDPVGYIADDKLWVFGITGNYVLLTYYRYPADPYFDYYTDAMGNITYLTDGQASYTLQTGEVSRDESVAGEAVTSVSVDLEWKDQDAMNILDMVMTDLGIAIGDDATTQGSILERQNNVRT